MKFKNLLLLTIIFPIFLLYLFEPSSFQYVWRGRFFYIIFLWLYIIEFILNWNHLSNPKFSKWRILGYTIAIFILILYSFLAFTDFRSAVIQLGRLLNVPFGGRYGDWNLEVHWPISVEYLIFTASFVAIIVLLYGVKGLRTFSVSSLFLGGVGFFYTIDTFYPFGAFGALQWFVPFVADSVAFILKSMGYGAQVAPIIDGWALLVTGQGRLFSIAIYWPCAGIHSLIMYSLVILLFLGRASIPFWRKIIYMVIGGIGTLMVNFLRIVSICLIGLDQGYNAANIFHESYGEMYFVIWIFAFLLVITTIETLKNRNILSPIRRFYSSQK